MLGYCPPPPPVHPPPSPWFHVIILSHPSSTAAGYSSVLDHHATHITCKFAEQREKLDWHSGMKPEDKPKALKSREAGIIQMILRKPVCGGSFLECPPLYKLQQQPTAWTVPSSSQLQGAGWPTCHTWASKQTLVRGSACQVRRAQKGKAACLVSHREATSEPY